MCGIESRPNGVVEGIFGREDDSPGRLVGGVRGIGPGPAVGDSGGEVECEEALTDARFTEEEGEFSERDASGPKPLEGGGLDL